MKRIMIKSFNIMGVFLFIHTSMLFSEVVKKQDGLVPVPKGTEISPCFAPVKSKNGVSFQFFGNAQDKTQAISPVSFMFYESLGKKQGEMIFLNKNQTLELKNPGYVEVIEGDLEVK